MTRSITAFLLSSFSLPALTFAGWDPVVMKEASTLEFRTVAKDEAPYWSTVWMVVIDGQVYVRLGRRANARIEGNTEAPYVAVRFEGEEFPRVKAEAAPEIAEKVNEAMADKYWTDIGIGWISHPLTARLVPEPTPAP